MVDIQRVLKPLAQSAFRMRGTPDPLTRHFAGMIQHWDAALQESWQASHVHSALGEETRAASRALFDVPDLERIRPRDGTPGPTLSYQGSGSTASPESLTNGLLMGAARRAWFEGRAADEAYYVGAVLAAFDQLCRAARGEEVEALAVVGIADLPLGEGAEISTPWGLLRPTPHAAGRSAFPVWGNTPQTRCVLNRTRNVRVAFSQPDDPPPDPPTEDEEMARVATLLPLAIALASEDAGKPDRAHITWWQDVIPFLGGFSCFPGSPVTECRWRFDTWNRGPQLQAWAKTVEASHVSSVDVAAKRLVSAIAHRSHSADRLIDAVTVWESLFGSRSETTFRVSAALAKLIEGQPDLRSECQRRLKKVYAVRSDVVHGARVSPANVDDAATQAVEAAVRALRAAYERGPEWLKLKSEERGARILLAGD